MAWVKTQPVRGASEGMLMAFIALLILIFGIGFYPKPVLDVITPSVNATMTSVGLSDPVGGN